MDLEPGQYHLKIRQGKTVRRVFTFKINGVLVNLTGYQAKAQVRSTPDSSVSLLSFDTATSTILLGGAAGTITLVQTAVVTAALTPINAVWELQLIEPNGDITPLLEGPCTIKPSVVR